MPIIYSPQQISFGFLGKRLFATLYQFLKVTSLPASPKDTCINKHWNGSRVVRESLPKHENELANISFV